MTELRRYYDALKAEQARVRAAMRNEVVRRVLVLKEKQINVAHSMGLQPSYVGAVVRAAREAAPPPQLKELPHIEPLEHGSQESEAFTAMLAEFHEKHGIFRDVGTQSEDTRGNYGQE